MRRTYRSKKDTGGALDHRDVLLNMDEKSSAFDAFYIQNLKQTKRELSCIASSNHVGIASNKVRKRKYVKRLAKEVEPVHLRQTSTSAYLTPDKSIRVNKILDPFDMLLNSSPAPSEPSELNEPQKTEIVETLVPKKESKTYVKPKRKPKLKKYNYSSTDSTESNENTINSNITDIKTHELLVEKVPSKRSICVDESINKIVGNLSLINNLKSKSVKRSFNTSFKTRNRLTKNYQSPIMQNSPLCSTPFKEKYRGVSIFKFSPIAQKNSPTFEEKDERNCSIILMSKSLAPKSSNEYKVPSLALVSNTSIRQGANLSVNDNNDNSIISMPEDKVQTEIGLVDDEKQNNNSTANNEASSREITETEPFLGFSNNKAESLTRVDMESMWSCLENQSVQVDLDKNHFVTKRNDHDDSSNINTNKSELGANKSDPDDSTLNNDTDKNQLGTNKSDPDDSSSNVDDVNEIESEISNCNDSLSNTHTDENDSANTSSNFSTDKDDSDTSKNNSEYASSTGDNDKKELDSNNSVSGESSRSTNTTIDSNIISNTNESTVCSESPASESLYDTCDSNQSSIADDNPVRKEPIVVIERINDSIFLKYFEKNVKAQDEVMCEPTDNDEFETLANEETMNEKVDLTNRNLTMAIVITDSSTTDDVVPPEENNDEEENYDIDERCVSFVTTRRRNEIVKDSMFQFDQSYRSSSTDCDKTVLSIKESIKKSENIVVENSTEDKSDINVENISQNNLNEKDVYAEENYEDMKTYCEDKIVSRTSTRNRKLRLSHKSNSTSPQTNDNDFISEKLANEGMSLINTRRGSKISRQSNSTSNSQMYDSKLSRQTNKRISRITTRNSSRLPKQSYPTSPKVVGNSKNDLTLRNLIEVDKAVENFSFEYSPNDLENKDLNSLLPPENISYMPKESIVSHPERSSYAGAEVKPTIVLQPGKKWERSLSIYRRMTMVADHFDQSILEDDCKQNKGRKYRQSVISTMEMQECRDLLHNDSINSRRSTFVSNPSRPTIRFVKDPNFSRVSLNTSSVFDDLKGFLSEECDDTVIELSKLSIADSERDVTILDNFHESERVTTARDYVLRRCNQTESLLFDECYPETVLKNCHKIGEGVYGEVFLWRGRDGRARVMKIVPIAGTVKVNGEQQKDFHEIISEIVIAMELSALRAPIPDIERQLEEGDDLHALDLHAIENATDIFNEVLAVRCVHGPYPLRLLDLWELYDECRGSENDNPASLPADQRYIVLELANAGQDLESYQFASAQQAHALFQQIAFGLAVGEEAFQFEHRDLHWGNVLIAPTEQKFATFVLRGRTYRVPRRGVAATVIDYSLSRLTLPLAADCAALYNDLATDDQLFDAVGDYQFELYRLMREKLGNDWKNFEPYTNILWLHYIVDKMITALRYKRTNTKIHKHYIEKLKGIKSSILDYGSAVQYVLTDIDF